MACPDTSGGSNTSIGLLEKRPKVSYNAARASCDVCTCCHDSEASTNPVLSDPAEREGSHHCHHSQSYTRLATNPHVRSHDGSPNYAQISSQVVSSQPVMSCCAEDTCCSGNGNEKVQVDSNSSDSIETKDVACGGETCCAGTEEDEVLVETKSSKSIEVNGGVCIGDMCCTDVPTNGEESSIEERGRSPVTIINADKVDGYDPSATVHQITLSVIGMTCTGCLKNLDQCLDSIPPISNIKTSLLLCQAVFDLEETPLFNKENIAHVITKKTGFSCAVIARVGQELDLVLDPNVPNLGANWPFGVVAIIPGCKNRVLVSYQPRSIGARELLSDPFFRHASLAPPSPPSSLASGRASVCKSLHLLLLSALLTTPILVLSYAQLPKHETLYGGIECGFASLVQFIIVRPFYAKAFRSLFYAQMIEMDMLVVLSTTVAYVYSVIAYGFLVAGKPLSTGEFFETSTLLVTLIMFGRYVAEYSRHKAVESISMESLQNPFAIIVEKDRQEREIDARLLQYDDIFKVHPESSIVTDGIVQDGETEVDESMVTGESTLISKKPGMAVIAGSLNHSGTIFVKLTHLPSENTIKTISTMVDEAKSSQPKVQEIADRVAGFFVPGILAITLAVFIIWLAVGNTILHQTAPTAAINAMTFAISTLIVSCPCAIGLAVPMVVLIAGGVGARHGLIFKTTETIEIGRKISHVIFDKTGTLTQGNFSVVEEEYMDSSGSVACAVLGLISNSKHPVSKALANHLSAKGTVAVSIDNITSIPGSGMEGTWKANTIRAGNPYWLGGQDLSPVRNILSRSLTTICVTLNGSLIAVFGLKDTLRPDAIETINELRKRSIEISLVSGDHNSAVKSLATHLGIPPSHTRSRCSPADKQEYVKSSLLVPNSVVLFCGDGTNDALALAQASIGLHINSGTEIAQSAADAILMRPSIKGILTLIDLSNTIWKRVLFNFAWSVMYNVFAILLAAGAFAGRAGGGVKIPPQYAGLGELVSVLPVIGVAAALRWKRF